MELIHVLGMGESLKEYKPDGCTTIGVNDIHGKIKTDFVVCVDVPTAFNSERLATLKQTNCEGFYSQLDEWAFLPNFNKIEFNRGRGFVSEIDNNKFCYSNNSTYVAVILAFKMGAKCIVLHGADFQTHAHFKGNSKDKVLTDFKELNKALKARGVTLHVGSSFSALAAFLPIFQNKN